MFVDIAITTHKYEESNKGVSLFLNCCKLSICVILTVMSNITISINLLNTLPKVIE